ncbi:MAG: glycosyltransferase family 2 protein [Thermoproteota archaeon]
MQGGFSLLKAFLFLLLAGVSFANLFVYAIILISYLPIKYLSYNYVHYNSKHIAVIAAHNEETVISDTIHNLLKAGFDYIFILLDNCTDNTKSIIMKLKQNYYMRINFFEDNLRSKTKILSKYLNYIASKFDNNDYIYVFDADNRVQEDFLRLSKQYDYDFVQFRIKVIQNNIFAAIYKYLYSFFIALQIGFNKLGLSAVFGGAGMRFKVNALKQYPFKCDTLTDDLEYSYKVPFVYFIPDAFVINEVPESFITMLKQFTRWIKGNIQNVIRINKNHKHITAIIILFLLNAFLLPFYITHIFYPANILFFLLFAIIISFRSIENIPYLPAIYILSIFFVIPYYNAIITFKNKNWFKTPKKGVQI